MKIVVFMIGLFGLIALAPLSEAKNDCPPGQFKGKHGCMSILDDRMRDMDMTVKKDSTVREINRPDPPMQGVNNAGESGTTGRGKYSTGIVGGDGTGRVGPHPPDHE